MGINKATYESILKEYEQLQLKSSSELEARKEALYKAVPELESLDSQITSLYIKRAMMRLDHSGSASDGSDEELKTQTQELSKKRSILISAAGFTESDLQPHYTCSNCKDTGYDSDGRMCSCFKSRIIEKLYDISHIRDILNTENFDTFSYKYYSDTEIPAAGGRSELGIAKDAVSKARSFIYDFDRTADNLFICGGTGVGKTFLTNCIARELIEQGRSVIYLSSVRFFEILADASFDRAKEDELSARLIYDCDLLIVDDLGTELTNSFVQTKLFDVINERFLKRKHTIISSNLNVRQLQDNYSERVFSRIASNYTVIKLFANDIRIQKALEV